MITETELERVKKSIKIKENYYTLCWEELKLKSKNLGKKVKNESKR